MARIKKTKVWILNVLILLFCIPMNFGCYHEINYDDFSNHTTSDRQRGGITKEDLKEFSSSIKAIDGWCN